MFKANRIVNMSNINVSGLNKGFGRGSQNNAVLKYRSFATHLLVGAVCFYLGIGVGVRVELIDCEKECEKQEEPALTECQGDGFAGCGAHRACGGPRVL